MNQPQKKFHSSSSYDWFSINIHYFTNNNPRTELAMHNAYTGIYTEVEERID